MPWAFAALLLLGRAAGAREQPGRALFAAHGCSSCHRIGGTGGNAGPDLTFVGLRRSREWLERWLQSPRAWKPGARMPEFKLGPGTRAALADFLSSLRGRESGLEGKDGRLIYLKAGCVACHGVKGAGGEPNNNVPGGRIPPLDAVTQTYTLEELVSRIKNGSTPAREDPLGPEPLVVMPAFSSALSDGEMTAVAKYVLTLGRPEEDSDW